MELRELGFWVCINTSLRLIFQGAYQSEIQREAIHQAMDEVSRKQKRPASVCTPGPCECCSSHEAVIHVPDTFRRLLSEEQQQQQQQEAST